MVKIPRKKTTSNAGEDVEQCELSRMARGNANGPAALEDSLAALNS